MDRIKELNTVFYELYGELYRNTKLLSKKQLDLMSSKLLEQYIVEYQKLSIQKLTVDKSELYEFKLNYRKRVPKRFLFFKNKIAKLLGKAVKREVKEYFSSVGEFVVSDKEESNSGVSEN